MTSTIKVNKIEKESGSTLTLGGPSTAVTLACGATQSGFGRTGTVNWCTTAKTGPLTAVSGNGYFLNTSGGAITFTLPSSPTAGDIVALKDYGNTWDEACKAVTVARNGSKINGQCACATLNTDSQSVTLIYVDGTKGWQDIQDSTSNVTGTEFVAATGGTITTSGDYKIHTFTGAGCFQVTNAGNAGGSNKISYLVIAGGGGGAGNPGAVDASAGAGAGGFREGKCSSDPYSASPLASTTALTASVATFPITVGGGGTAGPNSSNGGNGSNSIFSTITSAGGGGGNYPNSTSPTTGAGGSGSGAAASPTPGTFGAGNTPPVSPPQGNPGGAFVAASATAAGGGGGAGAVGGTAPGNTVAGAGGAGATTSINASPVQRAGGGGGSAYPAGTGGDGGAGGGGKGGLAPGNPSPAGLAGTVNTGGGGGAANANPGNPNPGGAGGSGIVIMRYKFQ